ncbi:LEA_2 domain-containing protein [Psidium guajava]|nr:LEA_2 domain-containing protein [Psidium guajava]
MSEQAMSTQLSKTDSEVSSLTPSSPGRSPPPRPHPAYYVQSPSRDSSSHDGEKTTNSFHSSPALLSPSGSPSHPSTRHSSQGPPSRGSSSSTRYSGSLKPAHRKGHPGEARRGKGFDAIEEEGLLDDGEGGWARGVPRRCYVAGFVLGFFVMFSFFALILWGASRPQKPSIAMKSIVFNQFVVQAGADFTGVATDMVSMNSTLKLTFRNTATFFGLHVAATPLDLSYSQLRLATGSIHKFYQSRKARGRSPWR